MKKILFTISALILSIFTFAQNVGIGTNQPTDQLHTTGTVRFQGLANQGKGILQVDDSGRVFTKTAVVSSQNIISQAIPDDGCATSNGANSSITLSGLPTSIPSENIGVLLNITHTFSTDLTIILTAPNGQNLLLTKSNFNGGANYTNTFFSDLGNTNNAVALAPFTDTFKPIGLLSSTCDPYMTFVSKFGNLGNGTINPNGTWELTIYDEAAQDVGNLLNWTLVIAPSDLLTVKKINSTEEMVINGNLKVNGGPSPKDGRILISDSVGNANWEIQKVVFGAVMETSKTIAPGSSAQLLSFSTSASSVGTYANYSGFVDNVSPFNGIGYGFEAPSAGLYHFDVRIPMNNFVSTTEGNLFLFLELNNSMLELKSVRVLANTAVPYSIEGSFNLKLEEGQNVRVKFGHTGLSGSITIPTTKSSFSGYKVN